MGAPRAWQKPTGDYAQDWRTAPPTGLEAENAALRAELRRYRRASRVLFVLLAAGAVVRLATFLTA